MRRARTNVRLHFWRLAVAVAHLLAGPFIALTSWCEARLAAVETNLLNRNEDEGNGA